MSSLVIVAIPEADDPVWDFSSEKVPHVTLLYLGDPNQVSNTDRITAFLEHAVTTTLTRFSLDVDRRGTLGPNEADVLFFEGWDLPELKKLRSDLLKQDDIRLAYDSVDQHPEWLPHLTMGYPGSPAKEPANGERGPSWVRFDRIAIWPGDYEGPEFKLKSRYYEDVEVSMSDINAEATTLIGDFLKHYGVKGMKWGQRKQADGSVQVTARATSGKAKVQTKGGGGEKPSMDAIGARVSEQRLKKSGINALSNQELQALALRLNLERNVKNLAPQSPGKKFAGDILKTVGKQQVNRAANDAAAAQVASLLNKK